MQDIKRIHKIFLIFFTFGIAVWLGGTLIRNLIAFDIFIPGTEFTLKENFTDIARMQTVRIFSMASLYTEIAYALSFISAIVLTIIFRKFLKKSGWFFMSFFLFFISAPIEFYLIYLDINLGWVIFIQGIDDFFNSVVQKSFVYRITKLNLITSLQFLAVSTSVIFIIWQPLSKKRIVEQVTDEKK